MKKKNTLIEGTLILTIAGLLCRFIGFFYRIFLSQTFGAEAIGVYQMAFPLFALSFSLCSAGIQTAISRFTAYKKNKGDILLCGSILSISLSFLGLILFRQFADTFSIYIMKEPRTAVLIRIMALSIPLESLHCAINGYYYGLKKAFVPSLTQLIEQLCRVLSVWFFCTFLLADGIQPGIQIAAVGIIIGEVCACIASLFFLFIHRLQTLSARSFSCHFSFSVCGEIIRYSAPLSANRLIINILASVEAISIPGQLRLFGLSSADALSIYGVLTGMALPLVLFPSALTNSISVMLLPVISEAQSKGNKALIQNAIQKCLFFCLLSGFACTAIFFFTGPFLGSFLFHSRQAGVFIGALGFLCPFLYLSSTFSSILHGLGKTTLQFVINLVALSIRLFFVFFSIPKMGIRGYTTGLLVSQCFTALLQYLALQPAIFHNIINPSQKKKEISS